MSGLPIILTPQGRAALINADNTGTSGLRIAQIGVSASAAGVTGNALQGEIKRLATFSGQVVAADTLHITIRDDTNAVYGMRAFALYLEDGTLLAWYAQAEVILQKSAQAILLLSCDIQFAGLNATVVEFGDTNWTNPLATTTVYGVLKLATATEAIAGESGVVAITPATLLSVLNARFGAGAPSAFVKGLLNLATATLFRTALEIKSAALKDEGAGNGLNADLLDGQHGSYYQAWANLTGKPSSFPPSAHQHAAGDVTSGTFANARISVGNVAQHQGALSIAWAQLTGAPAVWHAGNTLSGAEATAFRAGRSADQAIYLWGDTSGNYLRSLSAPNNAKGLIIDATTDSANSAPTSGANLISFRIRGVEYAQLNSAGLLSVGGNAVWHAGNFDPAGKANASHTHATLARGSYLTGSNYNGGSSATWAVDATATSNPSKVVARDASGDINARLFRSEYASLNANIGAIMTQVNAGGTTDNYIRPSSPAQVKAALAMSIADVANLQASLNAKATLGAAVAFQDVTASRGNGTGVIYFGNENRYLYYDGSKYQLPAAPLLVGGTVSAPAFAQSSSRRYKRRIETLSANDALTLLSGVRWVKYRMKADDRRAAGVIAEELADGPLDFVVTRTEAGVPDGVNYQPLFVLACAALRGLTDRVCALESRV